MPVNSQPEMNLNVLAGYHYMHANFSQSEGQAIALPHSSFENDPDSGLQVITACSKVTVSLPLAASAYSYSLVEYLVCI